MSHISEEWRQGVLMRKLTVLLPMALFVVFVSAAFSQSLADLAKKEKERRAGIKNDRVITEEEAAKYRSEPVKPATIPDQSSAEADSTDKKNDAESAAASGKPESDEPTDFQGRPESFWRKTMVEARQKVKDLETEANVLQLKRNQLQNDFYAADSGFHQQDIQRDIQKTIYEQDMNKENLKKAKDELQDLIKEARSSGALPGWIEGR